MEHFELVEKLRERTGLNYEEAKAALENSNWDLLEAMVRLENEGKVKADQPQQAAAKNTGDKEKEKDMNKDKERAAKADDVLRGIGAFLSRMAELGMRNRVEMRRNDKVIMSLPMLVVVLLALVAFWVIIPGTIVALFFGFRFKLTGKDVERMVSKEGTNQPQD